MKGIGHCFESIQGAALKLCGELPILKVQADCLGNVRLLSFAAEKNDRKAKEAMRDAQAEGPKT